MSDVPAVVDPARYFANARADLALIRERVARTLSPELTRYVFDEWAPSQAKAALNSASKVIESRRRAYEHLIGPASDFGDVARAHLETNDPSAIASELTSALKPEGLASIYETCLNAASEGPLGALVGRYRVPAPTVQGIVRVATQTPFGKLKAPLVAHADLVGEHLNRIREITGRKLGKGLATAAGIASSIATSVAMRAALGAVGVNPSPLAGRSGRRQVSKGVRSFVIQKMYGDRMGKSAEYVDVSFNSLASAFDRAYEDAAANLELAYGTVFGGLLENLEREAKARQRTILKADLAKGQFLMGLVSEASERYGAWAEETLAQIDALLSQQRLEEATTAAERAMAFSTSDAARSRVQIRREGVEVSYAVLLARQWAKALVELAEGKWAQGDYAAAARCYARLFTGSSIAWEYGGAPVPAHVMGWRMAQAATSSGLGLSEQERAVMLAAFPQYVYQFTARAEEPVAAASPVTLAGEYLDVSASRIAHLIERYGRENGAGHDLAARLPTRKEPWPEPAWVRLLEDPEYRFHQEPVAVERAPKPLRNDLWRWQRRHVRREQLGIAGRVLGLLLLIGGIVFAFYWLLQQKQGTAPKAEVEAVAAPAAAEPIDRDNPPPGYYFGNTSDASSASTMAGDDGAMIGDSVGLFTADSVGTSSMAGKSAKAQEYGRQAYVDSPGDGFLSIRSEPSIRSGRRVARLSHGASIEVGECLSEEYLDDAYGRWCRVRSSEGEGWAFSGFLRF